MFDWFFGQMWSAFFHWLGYWAVSAGVISGCIAGAWFSPFFKQVFIGGALATMLLVSLQEGFVSFKKKDPEICIHPKTDPNGPICQRWHATDTDRGFGYWEPCE